MLPNVAVIPAAASMTRIATHARRCRSRDGITEKRADELWQAFQPLWTTVTTTGNALGAGTARPAALSLGPWTNVSHVSFAAAAPLAAPEEPRNG